MKAKAHTDGTVCKAARADGVRRRDELSVPKTLPSQVIGTAVVQTRYFL